MASKVPPINAAQPKALPAQHDKRLRVRLAIWGAVAAMSLVVAVGAYLTGSDSERSQAASSGSTSVPGFSAATAVRLPPAELRAFKQASEAFNRATENTATKLAAVEHDTAATRAETKRLAEQVSKLTADSFHFTGRLANIEQQIDGITGTIKKQAQKAATDAVAKTMSSKPGYRTFASPAPIIGRPSTTPPKLSLLMHASHSTTPDTMTTSAITTPESDAGSKAKSGSGAAAGAKLRAAAKAGTTPDMKSATASADVKAEVGAKPKRGAIERRPHTVLTPLTEADRVADKALANTRMAEKTMAKGKAEAAAKTAKPPTKLASIAPTRRHASRHRSSHRTSYGVDLGGAGSITIAEAQWAAVKANFSGILAGLHLIAVRNHRILSSGTFRLVAGRLRSWAAAKRVCELLAQHQFACQPVKFQGEKVIWR